MKDTTVLNGCCDSVIDTTMLSLNDMLLFDKRAKTFLATH